jgi:CMP-N,N'-diacetyllegionaminic acid synthase
MSKKRGVMAVVPARSGSKGIRKKNLADLDGMPLLCYTIAAIRNSQLIDSFVVSTDSSEILDLGIKYGAKDIGLRPFDLSQDDSKTFDAVKFSLEKFEERYDSCQYVLELQPTYPFRNEGTIDSGIAGLINLGWDSFTTVRQISDTSHPDFVGKINIDGGLDFKNNPNNFRRQNLIPHFACVGSVMGAKATRLKEESQNLLGGLCGPVILSNQLEYFDINEVSDLNLANKILKNDFEMKAWYVNNLSSFSTHYSKE